MPHKRWGKKAPRGLRSGDGRHNPVTVTRPGSKPITFKRWPPGSEVWAESTPSSDGTRLPFLATITANGRTYEVEVVEIGMRFVRWID